jgi:hypothetical protein
MKSAVLLVLLTGIAFASSKPQSYTGVISDAMCGKSHLAGQSAAACTAACVKEGSAYALVVGDKVYKLEGKTDGLDKLAGDKATITGTASGDTITVESVAAAK